MVKKVILWYDIASLKMPGRAAGIVNHNFLAWEPKRPLPLANVLVEEGM